MVQKLPAGHDVIKNTFSIQFKSILSTLHGIYCDPTQKQETRINSLQISNQIKETITESNSSEILSRHSEYLGLGDEKKHRASQEYFEKLNLLSYLSDNELHSIVYRASKNLLNAHIELNNFYNEPPFAERLYEISKGIEIPSSSKTEFVQSIILGYIGNTYGVSRAAIPFYKKLIKGFSPKEIAILFDLSNNQQGRLYLRLKIKSCKERFSDAVKLIDYQSVPQKYKSQFDSWIL